MEHAVCLSEAFQLLDNGPKQSGNRRCGNRDGKRGGGGGSSGDGSGGSTSPIRIPRIKGRTASSVVLFPTVRTVPAGPRVVSTSLRTAPKRPIRRRARCSPTSPQRRRRTAPPDPQGDRRSAWNKPNHPRPTLRMQNRTVSPAAYVKFRSPIRSTVKNHPVRSRFRMAKPPWRPRADATTAATRALTLLPWPNGLRSKGSVRFAAITPIRLTVALKSGEEAQSFTFSRSWTSPRTVLHLASGRLALVNVTFLIPDDDLACEDILIGLPVLRHVQVDTRTLLENNRAILDGADCSNVGIPSATDRGGRVSRMMIARLNRTRDDQTETEQAKDPDRPASTTTAPDRKKIHFRTRHRSTQSTPSSMTTSERRWPE